MDLVLTLCNVLSGDMVEKDQPKQEESPDPKPDNEKAAKNGGYTIPAQMI